MSWLNWSVSEDGACDVDADSSCSRRTGNNESNGEAVWSVAASLRSFSSRRIKAASCFTQKEGWCSLSMSCHPCQVLFLPGFELLNPEGFPFLSDTTTTLLPQTTVSHTLRLMPLFPISRLHLSGATSHVMAICSLTCLCERRVDGPETSPRLLLEKVNTTSRTNEVICLQYDKAFLVVSDCKDVSDLKRGDSRTAWTNEIKSIILDYKPSTYCVRP